MSGSMDLLSHCRCHLSCMGLSDERGHRPEKSKFSSASPSCLTPAHSRFLADGSSPTTTCCRAPPHPCKEVRAQCDTCSSLVPFASGHLQCSQILCLLLCYHWGLTASQEQATVFALGNLVEEPVWTQMQVPMGWTQPSGFFFPPCWLNLSRNSLLSCESVRSQ